jgi:hypothetical protein
MSNWCNISGVVPTPKLSSSSSGDAAFPYVACGREYNAKVTSSRVVSSLSPRLCWKSVAGGEAALCAKVPGFGAPCLRPRRSLPLSVYSP